MLRWILVAVVAFAYLMTAIPSIWSGRTGANNFQDDAFYYLVPAKHFVATGAFTFDGETPTNGFHPLWMAVAVGLVGMTGADAPPEMHVFALKALENLVLGIGVALCMVFFLRNNEEGSPRAFGYLCIAAFLLCPRFFVFEQGMETTLAVVLFIIALECSLRERPIALGIALVALFLCRLDTALFIGLPMATWTVWRGSAPVGQRIWAIAPLLVALAIAPLTYLMMSGHPVPISGMVKSSFPHITWHGTYFTEPMNIARLQGWATVLWTLNPIIIGGLLLSGMALVMLAGASSTWRTQVMLIAIVGMLLLANLLLFQKWEKSVDPRYYALPMAAAMFVVGTGLAAITARVVGIASTADYVIPVAAMLVMSWNAWLATERAPSRWEERADWTTEVYREVANALPKDAVVAGTDVGALAFWTRRKVVNLDGVMNDYRYQEYLRDGKLQQYLRLRGVTHIGTALWEAEQSYTGRPVEPMYRHQVDPRAVKGVPYGCHRFYVYSYVFAKYSDEVCLDQSREVFRIDVGRQGIGNVAYVVYSLPAE